MSIMFIMLRMQVAVQMEKKEPKQRFTPTVDRRLVNEGSHSLCRFLSNLGNIFFIHTEPKMPPKEKKTPNWL